jgi:amino acid adenylation domain-containing protein
MTALQFLSYLRSLDIKVSIDGGKLRCNAPRAVLTPQLRDQLSEHKVAIVRLLGEMRNTEPGDYDPIKPILRARDLPLSFAQERLWFLNQLDQGSAVSNVTEAIHLEGRITIPGLEQSLGEITRRHEVLRAAFAMVEGKPFQTIAPPKPLVLPIVDLGGLPESDRRRESERLTTDEARRPFDLVQGGLLRITLLQLDPRDQVMLLTVHHIVSDDWSLGIFAQEMATNYDACFSGQSSTLSELPIQYADFASWQRESLKGRRLEDQLSYWKRRLGGLLPVLDLPGARPRGPVRGLQGARYPFVLPAALSEALNRLSKQQGVTLFILMLAAFKVLLFRQTGAKDILVGTPISGRNRVETEGLIGLFINMLILRTDLSGDPPFQELVSRVSQTALAAYANQDLPFEKLVAELQPERKPGRTSIAQVGFILQPQAQTSLAIAGDAGEVVVSAARIERGVSWGDLVLLMRHSAEGFHCSIEYSTDLFDEAAIVDIAKDFQAILQSVADNPQERISLLLPLTSQASPALLTRVGRKEELDDLFQKSNLTMLQVLIWISHKLQPDIPINNTAATFTIPRDVDRDHLNRALRTLIDSSDAMRTVIREVEGVPIQVVLTQSDLAIEWVDFSKFTDPEGLMRGWADRRCRVPFDLEKGLFAFALIKLSDEKHVFFLGQHHVIGDAYSGGLILRRLSELYEQSAAGTLEKRVQIPQFSEYVAFERRYRGSPRYGKVKQYWEARIADQLETMRFHGRVAAKQSTHGRRVYYYLEPSTMRKLLSFVARKDIFSGAQDLTTSSVLSGLLLAYLHRVSAIRDLSLGITYQNQASKSSADTIGLFLGVIPLRIRVDAGETFASLIIKVRTQTMEMLKRVPYAVGNAIHNKPYHVLFNYTNAVSPTFAGKPVVQEWLHTGYQDESLAVDFRTYNPQGDIVIHFDFDTKTFPPGEADRLVADFLKMLEALLDDHSRPISDVDLLSTAERQHIVAALNATTKAYPSDQTMAGLLEAQVRKTPDRICIAHEGNAITYGELNRRANRVGRALGRLGIEAESVLGLIGTRSIELLIGLVGIFKAGGAYLPLDPGYPPQRLKAVLTQSGSNLLLAGMDDLKDLRELGTAVRGIGQLIREESNEEDLEPRNLTGNLAYVIYTSGSTGAPKGAMINQSGMLNHIYAKIEDLGLLDKDIVGQTASQCFDISVWQQLGALVVGGRVEVISDEIGRDPGELLRLIERERVTILESVPTLLQAVIEKLNGEEKIDLSALRWMIVTGEAFGAGLCRDWIKRNPNVAMMNAYGPTECSDDVTHQEIRVGPAEHELMMPIGKGVGNMRMYVLDEAQRVAPLGVEGELYVGGIGVGRGYLKDSARTAEKFVADGCSGSKGERLYRTGDLVRYREGGVLEFIGRRDHQVKVRGYRIELGEIEAVLAQHEKVREAAVTLEEGDRGEKRLTGYVAANDGDSVDASELRSYLQEKVPEYMIPAAFVILDRLPLTANGKIDRSALLTSKRLWSESKKAFLAPRDTLELQLVRIWEDILDQSPIGIKDDFFELGGHSLLAVRLMDKIQTLIGQGLPLSVLFQSATVEYIADALREKATVSSPSPIVAIQPKGSRRPFFCVHPGSGDVYNYAKWAAHLGFDQPFYGLQDPKLYTDEDPYTSLEAMAALYVEAIRRVQPQGPYLLAGWSFGGHVAFEMAQQLVRHGESADMVAVIDTGSIPHLGRKFAGHDDASLLAIMVKAASPNTGKSVEELAADFRKLPPDVQFKEASNYAMEQLNLSILSDYVRKYVERTVELFKTRIRVLQDYRPSRYPGRITLIRASETPLQPSGETGIELPDEALDPSLGWGEFSSEPVEIHVIDGNHVTIALEPRVRELGRVLRACMDGAGKD